MSSAGPAGPAGRGPADRRLAADHIPAAGRNLAAAGRRAVAVDRRVVAVGRNLAADRRAAAVDRNLVAGILGCRPLVSLWVWMEEGGKGGVMREKD